MSIVVKFGGSVLVDGKSCQLQAERIASVVEEYKPLKVYIVVSAKKGETDRLISEVANNPEDEEQLRKALKGEFISPNILHKYNNPFVADRLLQGEIESAHLLASHLNNSRVIAQDSYFPIVSASRFLYLYGFIDEQESYARRAYLDVPEQIVIIPGFGAINPKGEKVLLGRNSSDLVAAMIALLTNSDKFICLKDEKGIWRDYGQSNQEVIPILQYQEAKSMDLGQVLDKRVLDLLEGSRLEVVIGHHEHLIELIKPNSRYGTRISMV